MTTFYVEPPAHPGERWTRTYPDGVRVLVLARVEFDSTPSSYGPPSPPARIWGHWMHDGVEYSCALRHLLRKFKRVKLSGTTHIPVGALSALMEPTQ